MTLHSFTFPIAMHFKQYQHSPPVQLTQGPFENSNGLVFPQNWHCFFPFLMVIPTSSTALGETLRSSSIDLKTARMRPTVSSFFTTSLQTTQKKEEDFSSSFFV